MNISTATNPTPKRLKGRPALLASDSKLCEIVGDPAIACYNLRNDLLLAMYELSSGCEYIG